MKSHRKNTEKRKNSKYVKKAVVMRTAFFVQLFVHLIIINFHQA